MYFLFIFPLFIQFICHFINSGSKQADVESEFGFADPDFYSGTYLRF